MDHLRWKWKIMTILENILSIFSLDDDIIDTKYY